MKVHQVLESIIGASALGSLALLAACGQSPVTNQISGDAIDWAGGCFTIVRHDPPGPPTPHTQIDDKFCVRPQNDGWYLQPGMGMEDWMAAGGGGNIPLTLVIVNPNNILWRFSVDIAMHPTGAGHGPVHEGEYGYQLQVFDYADATATRAQITGGGGPLGGAHGGTAHANLD